MNSFFKSSTLIEGTVSSPGIVKGMYIITFHNKFQVNSFFKSSTLIEGTVSSPGIVKGMYIIIIYYKKNNTTVVSLILHKGRNA